MRRPNYFKYQNDLARTMGRKETPLNKDTALWWASNIYTHLSPESLTCDGECDKGEVNRKYKELQSALRKCEKVLGRPISELEAYQNGKSS